MKISITYLETGHFQNEYGSVHARIEKAARHRPIFTSEQWYEVIASAKTKGHPYEVLRMKGKFSDLHYFCEKTLSGTAIEESIGKKFESFASTLKILPAQFIVETV